MIAEQTSTLHKRGADQRSESKDSRALQDWLLRIEKLHPSTIDLGLDRAGAVAAGLDILRPAPRVVTIAGTNGKGSTLRLLEVALIASGCKVGATTSPHLHRFNERISLCGQPVSDEQIVAAFEAVEAARGAISLTYFEYAVLAALWILTRANPDVVLLEVGLGGRLDAVNLVSADVGVITNIGIDHTAWLGSDRISIGREKAGILRSAQIALCGDPDPPESILAVARELAIRLHCRNRDFGTSVDADGTSAWFGAPDGGHSLHLPATALAPDNVLTALAVLHFGFPHLQLSEVLPAMAAATLPGRLEQAPAHTAAVAIWFDLGHNPDGATHVATELARRLPGVRARCLFGTLADKDSAAIMRNLGAIVMAWYLVSTTGDRGLAAKDLAARAGTVSLCPVAVGELGDLLPLALADARSDEILLICGSFDLVARARRILKLC